jgi:hypothetical protein
MPNSVAPRESSAAVKSPHSCDRVRTKLLFLTQWAAKLKHAVACIHTPRIIPASLQHRYRPRTTVSGFSLICLLADQRLLLIFPETIRPIECVHMHLFLLFTGDTPPDPLGRLRRILGSPQSSAKQNKRFLLLFLEKEENT